MESNNIMCLKDKAVDANLYWDNVYNNCKYKIQKKKLEKIKRKPKIFIVGYGSIINTKSRFNTGGKDIGNAIPVRIKSCAGLKRVWNFQKSKIAALTALGLETSNNSIFTNKKGLQIKVKKKNNFDIYCKGNGYSFNGVLYPIYDNIKNFDKREEGYFRLRLKRDQIESTSWQNLPNYKCKIYIYCIYPNQQNRRPTYKLPILQTYLDIVIKGCLEYGISYVDEFLNSTYGWNKWILNDRIIARRPWINEPEFKMIDKLLYKKIKYKAILPENYLNKSNINFQNLLTTIPCSTSAPLIKSGFFIS